MRLPVMLKCDVEQFVSEAPCYVKVRYGAVCE